MKPFCLTLNPWTGPSWLLLVSLLAITGLLPTRLPGCLSLGPNHRPSAVTTTSSQLLTSPGATSPLSPLNICCSCAGKIISPVISWMENSNKLSDSLLYSKLAILMGLGARAFSICWHKIQELQLMEQKKISSSLPRPPRQGRQTMNIFSSLYLSKMLLKAFGFWEQPRRARRRWRSQRYFSYPWGRQLYQGRPSLSSLSWQSQCNFDTVPPWCLFWLQLGGREAIETPLYIALQLNMHPYTSH